jgi:hypothetical protein
MAIPKLSKVSFSKSTSEINFATEEYIFDFLEMLKAKSRLPIKQILSMLLNKEADTVSCSRDDTGFSFFASEGRNGISVIVKELGKETIEFNMPKDRLEKVKLFS